MDETQHASLKALFSLQYLIGPCILLSCVLSLRWPLWARLVFFGCYATHLFRGMSMRTGDTWFDYSNGSTLSGDIVKTMYMLFLVDPVRDWRHKSDGKRSIASFPWWKRVYWCICAAFTMRGVGWNYQISQIPSPSRLTRSMFLCATLLRALSSYLLLDAVQCLLQVTPFFNNPQTTVSMRSHSYIQQSYYMALSFTIPYASIKFHYSLAAFIAVASGYSLQEDWPDMFGSWFDAYSVRNLWGKTWHQLYRNQYSTVGKFVAGLLGAPRRTILSVFIQLHVAFLVSGLSHSFGDYTVGFHKFGHMTLPFFALQPFAIMFEELFLFTIKSLSNSNRYPFIRSTIKSIPSPMRRCLGYTWTLAWFTYSASWYIDPAAQAGFGRSDIIPWSIIRFVVIRIGRT
ncbi:hypothetical protein GYMLUDRAFT_775031 [Collybiopsis luxurians FD-317 M1]|uniref:Wax synthase domain-containing protein n=1 Tax=Collybiopsis luxurians FD-317 M1 TaxID=944289 RepID=A0A0D0C3B8_9AGAR|nr:hypothetical protein GYMLUDRAFT_775031 [Collybiopsis luxurians FD-317 M1]